MELHEDKTHVLYPAHQIHFTLDGCAPLLLFFRLYGLSLESYHLHGHRLPGSPIMSC